MTSEGLIRRPALGRLLESLLHFELAVARGRKGQAVPLPQTGWPDNMRLDDAPGGLGCDSLELIWLSSAVNEMFHLHAGPDEIGLRHDAPFGAWLDRVEAAWADGNADVTFTTSGSTGRPKRCAHSLSHLRTEVEFLAGLFADRRRVVALAPAHHIYGCLFTVMLPSRLGIEVLDAESMSPAQLRSELRPGDLVVSFPERWRWLERSLPSWPSDVRGIVSTAPCPPDLIAELIERGLAGITEVYGSSETAGIATRAWPEQLYTLMPHWRFPEGFDPDRPAIHHSSGAAVSLMDRIARQAARGFTLAGRLDGMVQVGGINVDPGQVAGSLASIPGVAAAAVRLMRPSEGVRLKAFIVPDNAAFGPGLRVQIDAWVREHLPAAQRPTSLTFGAALPRDKLGKAADWAIDA